MLLSELLFSFQGRINRQTFWLAYLATIVVVLALILLVAALAFLLLFLRGDQALPGFGPTQILLTLLIYGPSTVIFLALSAKRLHDRGKSGWWLILYWVVGGGLFWLGYWLLFDTIGYVLIGIGTVINLLGLIDIGFLPGKAGPNIYGPDPATEHAS